MILPSKARVRFTNLGTDGRYVWLPVARLSLEQIRELERSPLGEVWWDNGVNKETQTEKEDFPESSRSLSTQTNSEVSTALAMILDQMTFVEVVKPVGDSQARLTQMVKNVVTQFSNFRLQLGSLACYTVFNNINKLAAACLGVVEHTVIRYNQKASVETKSKQTETRKKRNLAALELLDEEERALISDHIDKCYEEDSNFSIHSLHFDLQNLYQYPYSESTLYRQLKALRYSYKLKTFNPFSTVREDIVAWRSRYLKEMEQLRLEGAFVCYYDETWVFHGMTKTRGWNRTDTSPYLIANMGNLKKPRPGFAAASDKGQRAIVLAVTTESEILQGSVDVVYPDRPESEVLVDYHQYMSSKMYMDYMRKVLPLIVAATPPGRKAILVIDNASVHNAVVEKIPTKNSNKPALVEFLTKSGLNPCSSASKDHLWDQVQAVIESSGGRNALRRYVNDELAAQLGVKIVRLPPYHCQFSPIELVWNQLKSHLRTTGKTTDKLDIVAQRAKAFLSNITPETMAWTYEHVIDIEEGIKVVMEEEDDDDDL